MFSSTQLQRLDCALEFAILSKRRGTTAATGLNHLLCIVGYRLRASLAGLQIWLKQLRL